MSKIRILPEILSNKIAAGEVVERPASVVKELVENAVDAGSTRIIVEIEQGGRKLIRVSDNGQGMGRDDALLCLDRYATSKIKKDPDLFAIRTLGFRGEALPSIASVSRFTIVTREPDDDVGTRIEVAGGRIQTVADAGAPAGTMVTVATLFYNTPARRKFLKSINTEMSHIADTIASMALCRPLVQFRLSHNNRIVKNWAPVKEHGDRVADVLGMSIKKELFPVERSIEEVEISGWVASPRMSRSTGRSVYLFVNGRWVKDRVIQHALFAGYTGRLMKGQYPVAVLFLNVPYDQVDVNVHPTKHEIRFVRQKNVHDAVRDAVTQTLRQTDPTRWAPPPASISPDAVRPPVGVSEAGSRFKMTKKGEIRESRKHSGRSVAPDGTPKELQPMANPALDPLPPCDSSVTTPADTPTQKGETNRQVPLWKPRFFSDLLVIGQYRGTYIICESVTGLILIDQHAAHERIVFEQLKHQSKERRPPAQHLLLPETFELGFRESQILETLSPELNHYGLEIEPFGGNTFVVKTLPTILDSSDVPAIISEIVEKTAEIGVDAQMDSILDGCLMVMACHNAIRAHQQLSNTQITAMLDQLDRCDNPSHCPHGRPIWIQWTDTDLEKQFQRIVHKRR